MKTNHLSRGLRARRWLPWRIPWARRWRFGTRRWLRCCRAIGCCAMTSAAMVAPRCRTGPYTLEQMADDLRALLDRLGIAETAFVGLSMGGLIGMTAALADPARITRLVLCDTTARYGARRRADVA